ncbi:hypothetical protein BU15DRAFT_27510, partial [Melanogaster broomeanus]
VMRTNIERALNDLVVSDKDITLSNILPAYLHEAGFDEISHDALEPCEHAMDEYLLLPSKSRVVSQRQILGLMVEYWFDK